MRKYEELVGLINAKHPEWKTLSVRGLKAISGYSHDASRLALLTFRSNEEQTTKTPKNKSSHHPPQGGLSRPPEFIDDPNELLMSCAKRQLNKKNPDVKWATILVNILKETKQLATINKEKSEIQSKLKQYSTEDLTRLRKRLTGNLQEGG